MPSKTSKSPQKPHNLATIWKERPGCSELELSKLAGELARQLKAGDRVLLEGPMGAGKSTFARALLEALGVQQMPEGSPSFAIAHEYDTSRGFRIAHVDLYRIKHEAEIDEAGIPDYFWDPSKLVLCEWLSMWPEFQETVLRAGSNWSVSLEFVEENATLRRVTITRSV